MAYNLKERFDPPPFPYKLLDPGAYQNDDGLKVIKENKVPFLSNIPRNTQPCGRIWTHAIYDATIPHKIPNITSMASKRPRFPYEAFSKEDLEALLCRCGIQNACECTTDEAEEEQEVLCQGKVRRRIFKGPAPKSLLGEGLSAPSKRDRGFELLIDGTQKRLLEKVSDESPPFYDATVHESTAFYHGCKWGQWTTSRSSKPLEKRPGPADYNITEKPQTDFEKYVECFKFQRRKNSKQLRFIEMVQQRDILEGRPGPATYSPMLPRYDFVEKVGAKAERFATSKIEQRPGPADYSVKRAFDLPKSPEKPCHARLPDPPFFGIKAQRFKPRREEGPSPASYNISFNPCHFMHCPTTAFGSSTVRFKEIPIDEDDEETEVVEAEYEPQKKDQDSTEKEPCPTPSWEFKSKTVRMKGLEKKLDEPSPADLPQTRTKVSRLRRLQFIAPFYTSEGRFQPWYDWMPVFGRVKTPGPCCYSLEKPKCYPAVKCGPLYRSIRFPRNKIDNPAPNKYKHGGGIETILATHNQKLKHNIENQHKFLWVPPVEPRRLSYEEREAILLNNSIALLDTEDTENKNNEVISPESSPPVLKPKLLRCFVYNGKTPQ